jgi:hypothetical protein
MRELILVVLVFAVLSVPAYLLYKKMGSSGDLEEGGSWGDQLLEPREPEQPHGGSDTDSGA